METNFTNLTIEQEKTLTEKCKYAAKQFLEAKSCTITNSDDPDFDLIAFDTLNDQICYIDVRATNNFSNFSKGNYLNKIIKLNKLMQNKKEWIRYDQIDICVTSKTNALIKHHIAVKKQDFISINDSIDKSELLSTNEYKTFADVSFEQLSNIKKENNFAKYKLMNKQQCSKNGDIGFVLFDKKNNSIHLICSVIDQSPYSLQSLDPKYVENLRTNMEKSTILWMSKSELSDCKITIDVLNTVIEENKIKDIALYENCGFTEKNFDQCLNIEFDKDKVNQKINNELSKKSKSNIQKNKSAIDRAKTASQQTTNKNKAISKDER